MYVPPVSRSPSRVYPRFYLLSGAVRRIAAYSPSLTIVLICSNSSFPLRDVITWNHRTWIHDSFFLLFTSFHCFSLFFFAGRLKLWEDHQHVLRVSSTINQDPWIDHCSLRRKIEMSPCLEEHIAFGNLNCPLPWYIFGWYPDHLMPFQMNRTAKPLFT